MLVLGSRQYSLSFTRRDFARGFEAKPLTRVSSTSWVYSKALLAANIRYNIMII